MNGYKIEFDEVALKQFRKLEKKEQKQIASFLDDLLIKINEQRINPFLLVSPLMGNFKGLHRFRTGNYRLIVKIQEEKLIIHLLKIGHRKDVYE